MRLRGHLSGTVRGTAKGTVRRKQLAVPEVMRGGRNAMQKASHMVNNRRNLFSIGWDLEDDPMNARDDRHTTVKKSSETHKTRHCSREAPGYVNRCQWFDSLARAYFSERCFSEAAICQAHSVAIVGKELENRGLICLDWSLFNALNNQIVEDETQWENKSNVPIQGNEYSVENFTTRIQELIHTLVLDEHYEAVGPIYRLVIPIYEQHRKYAALLRAYAELHQATRRASEFRKSVKRHMGSYFLVVFLGKAHFGKDHGVEWIYREPKLTSLAEACDRMVESVRHALGHNQVEILPSAKKQIEVARLNPSTAYIQVRYVEPCSVNKLKRQVNFDQTGADVATVIMEDDDPMCYRSHTNVTTFVYDEKMIDESIPNTAPEQARLAVKRIILRVEKGFPNTRRRQKVVDRTELILNPLELACDSILFKAAEIRRVLNDAAVMRRAYGFDKSALRCLDIKQLQLLLQGAVSPTVNAGVLSYAQAFTSSEQRQIYGSAGIAKLVSAFKILMTELSDALKINEAAMGNKRPEYKAMLSNSFKGMVESLSVFFSGEKFIQDPVSKAPLFAGHLDGNAAALHSRSSAMTMHILDSTAGMNT